MFAAVLSKSNPACSFVPCLVMTFPQMPRHRRALQANSAGGLAQSARFFTLSCIVDRAVKVGREPTRWTRHQVAEHLGVSIATVRRMEGRELHPEIEATGIRLFDATEVRLLRAERGRPVPSRRDRAGAISAKVFGLFRSDADLREIVITAHVRPTVVRDLYDEWLVGLNDGEQRRRAEKLEAGRRRERDRADREHREFLKQLGTSQGR